MQQLSTTDIIHIPPQLYRHYKDEFKRMYSMILLTYMLSLIGFTHSCGVESCCTVLNVDECLSCA